MRFIAPALVLLVAAFLLPLLYVVYLSFGGSSPSLEKYAAIATEPLYRQVLLNSVYISVVSTGLTLLLGYPIAYHLEAQPPRRRTVLMILVLMPFWTSILVKSFAFTVILGKSGIINSFLQWATGMEGHLPMLFNRFGVVVGMTHFLLPFMVFTVLASLLTQGPELRRAANVMGATRLTIFWRIIFPLSLPGVMAGILICMIMSMAMFITPALLGGRGDLMISNLVEFHVRDTLDWEMASALAVCLLAITGVFCIGIARVRGGQLFGEEG
ncbi:hypothetical protein LNKW23_43450 [Paralimibaculum aggregatum]|uniref:ABC transmembrane type-1 domain-containing protein n=1 Tax=Paralimibaculum aggregatum TaxID=3036245 RepID=A0ABQ6LSU4_9RHOB|nr:ABC transporter permease [Limibaculum sp. NKW23]GMG85129.1 hypothetical protein LNKW23_43450 [Limibaculum sp. NKW23]